MEFSKQTGGYSMVEGIVMMAITCLTTMAMISMYGDQFREVKKVKSRLEVLSTKQSLRNMFTETQLCSCQLNADQNTAYASVLKINTLVPSSPDIELPVLRSSCNFSDTTNIIAKKGQALSSSNSNLVVSDMRLTSIFKSGEGNEYQGIFRISLVDQKGVPTSLPIETRLRFAIDPVAGTPDARKITACVKPPAVEAPRITACPAGFTYVDYDGNGRPFCIETASRAPTSYNNASNICLGVKPAGYNTAEMCNITSLEYACKFGKTAKVATYSWSSAWLAFWPGYDPPDHYFFYNANCDTIITYYDAYSLGYRCCIY